MSETPTCATCRYFDRTGRGYGWCRRYAPRSYVGFEHRDEAAASYFPLVAEDDWCGEWRATEAAQRRQDDIDNLLRIRRTVPSSPATADLLIQTDMDLRVLGIDPETGEPLEGPS